MFTCFLSNPSIEFIIVRVPLQDSCWSPWLKVAGIEGDEGGSGGRPYEGSQMLEKQRKDLRLRKSSYS